MNRDDQVAALLEAGATYEKIKRQLHVSNGAIRRIRVERRIPLPPERAKRSRSELDAVEQQAIGMLTSGATVEQARAATRLSRNRLAWLRREHRIPVPERDLVAGQRRTVKEAFVLYAKPTSDGHVLWTGPMSGRMPQLYAEDRRLNARHVAFERHHGHSPTGYVRAICTEAACIDGAHLADAVMRGTVPAPDQDRTASAARPCTPNEQAQHWADLDEAASSWRVGDAGRPRYDRRRSR